MDQTMTPPPWQSTYPTGLRWDMPIPSTTVDDELRAAVTAHGDRPYLEFGGHVLSFAECDRLVERAASGFRAIGVGPGCHVALHLPNVFQYPIAFFAVLRAGGVVVNLSPLDAAREIAHKLAVGEARIVVSFAGLHAGLPSDRPDLTVVIASPDDFGREPPPLGDAGSGPVPFSALLAPAPAATEWPTRQPGDLAVLQFTGGTTGQPKAAMLTHANLTAALSIYHLWNTEPDGPREHRVVTVLPLFHIYALSCILLTTLRTGYMLILKPRWDTDDILDTITRLRPTVFFGVPTMYRAMMASPRARETDFSCFSLFSSGGAQLPLELQNGFARLTGQTLYEGWGMTETCSAGTGSPRDRAKAGAAGVPLPGVLLQIRDLADPHRVLPPGEKGEVCIRGPNVVSGYYRNEAANAESFVDGFFRTGDVGTLDEEGYLFLVDRLKDMIISSGFNVYPRLIEEATLEHPAVAEVTVIGVPDAYRGEKAKAFVVLRPDASPFTLDDLRSFLADKLGRHELPGALEFRDQLPKTAVGKAWKKPLVDEERARAAAEAAAVT